MVDKHKFVDLMGGYLWKIRKHKALLSCIRIYSAAKRQSDQRERPQKKLHLPIRWTILPSMRKKKNTFLSFQPPSLEFCYSSPRKLIHGDDVTIKLLVSCIELRGSIIRTQNSFRGITFTCFSLDAEFLHHTVSSYTLMQVNSCQSWKTFKFLFFYTWASILLLFYIMLHPFRRLNIRIYLSI